MIVREQPSIFKVLFSWRGTILTQNFAIPRRCDADLGNHWWSRIHQSLSLSRDSFGWLHTHWCRTFDLPRI